MKKEIVVESGVCLYSSVVGAESAKVALEETQAGVDRSNCLTIKLPVGYADLETANGNVYESDELIKAFGNCRELMKAGGVHGCHGEHPKDRVDIRPDEISHLVVDAWLGEPIILDGKKVVPIWNKWVIVPTDKAGGRDLINLFLAGASIGTSIRGLAVREGGKYMRHYEYKGTDTVTTPSTGFKPGLSNLTLRAEVAAESLDLSKLADRSATVAPLTQSQVVMENSQMDVNSIVGEIKAIKESLEGGKSNVDLLSLGAKIGAMEGQLQALKSSSEVKESELKDAKAQLESISQIRESLAAEKDEAVKASESYKKTVESLGEDLKKLTTQVESLTAEKTKSTAALESTQKELETLKVTHESAMTKSEKVVEELRDYTLKVEKAVEDTRDYALKAEGVIEGLRDHSLNAEAVVEEARDYALAAEQIIAGLRDHALTSEKAVEDLRKHSTFLAKMVESLVASKTRKEAEFEASVKMIEALRNRMRGSILDRAPTASMENYVRHLLDKNPILKNFSEELRACTSIRQVNTRATKYVEMLGRPEAKKAIESVTESTVKSGQKKTHRPGIERFI